MVCALVVRRVKLYFSGSLDQMLGRKTYVPS
jgi:hypothetical protein